MAPFVAGLVSLWPATRQELAAFAGFLADLAGSEVE
jgi:hypothetical protein